MILVGKHIGLIIKEIREAKGLSQRKVAKSAGLSPSYISQIESGKKTSSITLRVMNQIAKGIGVPPSVFVDMLAVDNVDIRAFITTELADLDDVEKDWLHRSITMIRERKSDRHQYRVD